MQYKSFKDANKIINKSNYLVQNPANNKNRWNEEFGNKNPIHLELGCGRGGFLTQNCIKYPDVNHIAIDIKDEVLIITLNDWPLPNSEYILSVKNLRRDKCI